MRLIRLLGFALPVLVIDQLSKYWVDTNMTYRGSSIPVVDGWFALTYARNQGSAWSMLWGQKWLLVAFAVVASVAIVWHALRGKDGSRGYLAALGLLLGGAVGNLIDRVRFGYVIDMFDLQNGDGRNIFPIFNVADIGIDTGVGLILLLSFLESRREKRAKAAGAAPS